MAFDLGTAVGYLLLDTSKWEASLKTANQGLNTLTDNSTKAADKFAGAGTAMASMGKAMTLGVTAPLLGAGAAAVKTASDWETAWTGVTKTVEGASEELEDALFDISKRTASMPAEVAAVAEAAGQLGIATENIASFSETMVQLGDTTNLSADEAATALARFANITSMSQGDFDRLGSVIVDLGNNFATTEAEIVALGSRLAGAGSQIGLTESQIMGFAAALSSVGIEAEAGGTALSKVFVDMQLAVETGGESLNQFAGVAGMTADQFAQSFREDAAGAIQAFIQGLASSEERGLSAIAVLDSMGISEVRLRDALLRASNASDIFGAALETANTAWTENTALTNEASKRYGTFESQVSQLKASLQELIVSFGELLLPILTDLIGIIGDVVEWLNSLDDGQKQTIIDVLEMVAVMGPLLTIFGKLFTAIGTVVNIIAGGGGLMAVLTALINPVTLVVAAVAALAAAWITNFGNIRDKTKEFVDKIVDTVKGIGQALYEAGSEIFNKLFEGIKSVWNSIHSWVQDKVNWIKDKLSFWNNANNKMSKSSVPEPTGRSGGSYASGLDYVPRDMNVRVHEGERILTAEENRGFNQGMGRGGPETINFELSIPMDGEVLARKQYSYNLREGVLRGDDLVEGGVVQ